MNKYIITAISAFAIANLFISCSTSSKISFKGKPGTEIYTPDGKQCLGAIPVSGELKTTVPDNGYYGLLIAKNPATKEVIPFAMNTKYARHGATKFASGLGMGFAGVGTAGLIIGTIILCVNSDATAGPVIAGAGGALAGIGASFGVAASARADQTSYKYCFKYFPVQETNSDIRLTEPIIKNSVSYSSVGDSAEKNKIRPDKKSDKANSSENTHVNRKLGGTVKQLVGKYAGNGSITLKGEEFERILGITIIIEYKSNNEAYISLIESDGNDFFGKKLLYQLDSSSKKKNKKTGQTILLQSGIPSSKIIIDKKGYLILENPRLEIDGEVYTLKIKAELQSRL